MKFQTLKSKGWEVLSNSNFDRGMSATSMSNSVEYLSKKRNECNNKLV